MLNNKKGQVLVPQNKNIANKSNFKISKGSIIYQIFFSIILVLFIYYIFNYVINKIGKLQFTINGTNVTNGINVMKGGKKLRWK